MSDVWDLFISSIDRDYANSNDHPGNFTIPAGLIDIYQTSHNFRIILKTMTMTRLRPNIRTGVNDSITVYINDVAKTLVFDEGEYNATQLAEAIQSGLIALDAPGWVVGYDVSVAKLEITVPVGKTLRFPTQSRRLSNNVTVFNVSDRFMQVVGWVGLFGKTLTSGVWSDSTVMLSDSAFVDVTLNVNTNAFHARGTLLSPIIRIPIDCDFGDTMVYENQYYPGTAQPFGGQALSNLRITLYDMWGEEYNLPSNGVASFHFKLVMDSNTKV